MGQGRYTLELQVDESRLSGEVRDAVRRFNRDVRRLAQEAPAGRVATATAREQALERLNRERVTITRRISRDLGEQQQTTQRTTRWTRRLQDAVRRRAEQARRLYEQENQDFRRNLGARATFIRNLRTTGIGGTALTAGQSLLGGLGRLGGAALGGGALAGGVATGVGAGVLGAGTVAFLRAGGLALSETARNAAVLASDLERAERALNALGAFRGVPGASQAVEEIQEATRGTVTELEAFNIANRVLLSNVPELYENIGDVVRDSSDVAAVYGITTEEAIERIIRGITKLEPELLDELGIRVRLREATAAYALEIGKSVDELTQQERVTAFANATLTQLNANAVATGRIASQGPLTVAQRLDQMRVEAERARDAFGRIVTPSVLRGLETATGWLTSIADRLSDIADADEITIQQAPSVVPFIESITGGLGAGAASGASTAALRGFISQLERRLADAGNTNSLARYFARLQPEAGEGVAGGRFRDAFQAAIRDLPVEDREAGTAQFLRVLRTILEERIERERMLEGQARAEEVEAERALNARRMIANQLEAAAQSQGTLNLVQQEQLAQLRRDDITGRTTFAAGVDAALARQRTVIDVTSIQSAIRAGIEATGEAPLSDQNFGVLREALFGPRESLRRAIDGLSQEFRDFDFSQFARLFAEESARRRALEPDVSRDQQFINRLSTLPLGPDETAVSRLIRIASLQRDEDERASVLGQLAGTVPIEIDTSVIAERRNEEVEAIENTSMAIDALTNTLSAAVTSFALDGQTLNDTLRGLWRNLTAQLIQDSFNRLNVALGGSGGGVGGQVAGLLQTFASGLGGGAGTQVGVQNFNISGARFPNPIQDAVIEGLTFRG